MKLHKLPPTDNAIADAFVRKVADYAAAHGLLADGGVLLGLSGGADSTALLLILLRLGVRVEAAHCNFGLRGDEADADEQAVEALCLQLHVPLTVTHFDVADYRRRHPRTSVEMACRELRYPWFEQLRQQRGLADIAVAHHADDNVETALLNALRGTGLRGVAGMAPRNGHVVRPLLCATRAEIEAFLAALGQPYATDSTNAQTVYARNRVRHLVLPAIEAAFPHARQRLRDTVAHLRDCATLHADLLRQAAASVNEGSAFVTSDERTNQIFDARRLQALTSLPDLLLFELLQPCGFNRRQCDNALKCALKNGSESRQFHSSTHTLTVQCYLIGAEQRTASLKEELEVDFGDLSALKAILEARTAELPFHPKMCDGRSAIALHPDVTRCQRVVLRHWRRGDRLQPFGMDGSRLVSDILTEAHLTPQQKRRAWLLEADGQILWVLGHRASRHYPVAMGAGDYLLLHAVSV